jgi:hypothetical protein
MASADFCPITRQVSLEGAMITNPACCPIRTDAYQIDSNSDKTGRCYTGHPIRCLGQIGIIACRADLPG